MVQNSLKSKNVFFVRKLCKILIKIFKKTFFSGDTAWFFGDPQDCLSPGYCTDHLRSNVKLKGRWGGHFCNFCMKTRTKGNQFPWNYLSCVKLSRFMWSAKPSKVLHLLAELAELFFTFTHNCIVLGRVEWYRTFLRFPKNGHYAVDQIYF